MSHLDYLSSTSEAETDNGAELVSTVVTPTSGDNDDRVSMSSRVSNTSDILLLPNINEDKKPVYRLKELSRPADDVPPPDVIQNNEPYNFSAQQPVDESVTNDNSDQLFNSLETGAPSLEINNDTNIDDHKSLISQTSTGVDRLILPSRNENTSITFPRKELSTTECDDLVPPQNELSNIPRGRQPIAPPSIHSSHGSFKALRTKVMENMKKIQYLSGELSTRLIAAIGNQQTTNGGPIIHQETRERMTEGTRSIIGGLPHAQPEVLVNEFQGVLQPGRQLSFQGDKIMNRIMYDLMYLKERPSVWSLSIEDVKDIIMELNVSCSLFLTLLGGLPFSGKSTFIQNFLKAALFKHERSVIDEEQFKNQYNEKGLSRYGVSILGHKPYHELLWFTETLHSLHTFSCGASILHDSLLQGQQVELTDREILTTDKVVSLFGDDILNQHMSRVYTDIDQILQRADTNPELKRILSSGALFVNIFDVGLGKGVLEFLTLISKYGRNRINLVCLSMDDVYHLYEPPNLEYERYNDIRSSALRKGSRLLYLVRYATAMHFGCPCNTGQSSHLYISFIITCNDRTTKEKREEAKLKLQEALSREARERNMPFLGSQPIIVVDTSSDESLQEFKIKFEGVLKGHSDLRETMKLSWLFLRSALSFTDKVIISYDELEIMAAELNIQPDDFKSFIDKFSKFASIFYFPEIKPLAKTIILQPVSFVNQLSLLFLLPNGAKIDQFNGIFTQEQIHQLIQDDDLAELIVSTLCYMGLASETTDTKIDRKSLPTDLELRKSIPRLFVPLAKNGSLSKQTSNKSLFIIYEANLTPPDLQGLFATELLNNRNIFLVSTTEANVIKFQYLRSKIDCMFCLIFQATHIEVFIEHYSQLEVCDKILNCCTKALNKMSKMLKEFSHKFAIRCLKPQMVTAEGEGTKKKEFEYLPEHNLCYLCDSSKSALRKKWNESIQDIHNKTIQANDIITPDRLLDLATELAQFMGSDLVRKLAMELDVIDNTEVKHALSHYFSWQRVFIILLAWERKMGKEKASKTRLSRTLIRMGYVSSIV